MTILDVFFYVKKKEIPAYGLYTVYICNLQIVRPMAHGYNVYFMRFVGDFDKGRSPAT